VTTRSYKIFQEHPTLRFHILNLWDCHFLQRSIQLEVTRQNAFDIQIHLGRVFSISVTIYILVSSVCVLHDVNSPLKTTNLHTLTYFLRLVEQIFRLKANFSRRNNRQLYSNCYLCRLAIIHVRFSSIYIKHVNYY